MFQQKTENIQKINMTEHTRESAKDNVWFGRTAIIAETRHVETINIVRIRVKRSSGENVPNFLKIQTELWQGIDFKLDKNKTQNGKISKKKLLQFYKCSVQFYFPWSMVLPLKDTWKRKNTLSDRDGIHGHQNLN